MATSPVNLPVELPANPYVIIEPAKSWSAFDLRELWEHRELLYFLVWRDLKVRYKQTLFGVAWVVLQPLLMTVIFTLFLGMLVRVPTEGVPYPLLAFSGLLVWTCFASAVQGAAQGLVANASLITKVYFPRLLIPAASVLGRIVDLGVSFAIIIVLILYYRVSSGYAIYASWKLLLLPFLVVLLTMWSLAVALLVSSLNVRYRDVGVALPVLIQLWMFVSPIVYPVTIVPEKWRLLYALNPITGLVQSFRASLFDMALPVPALAMSVLFTLLLLVVAFLVFKRTERTFADIV